MGFTIYYKGTLKAEDSLAQLVQTVSEKCRAYRWDYSTGEGIIVQVPDGESLVLRPSGGKINAWVKYCGQDNAVITGIFEILWAIKPCFKRLAVADDFGLWEDYIAQFSKERLPELRALKENERAEWKRGFDLPAGSNSILPMNRAHAVIMFMMLKDMSRSLNHVMDKADMIRLIEPSYSFMYRIDPKDESNQLIGLCETWFVTRLRDRKGAPLVFKEGGDGTVFAWIMAEVIYGFWGGSLSSKHAKMQRFLRKLARQNVDLDDPETFLRFIYSTAEALGAYRSDDLIERRRPQNRAASSPS